MNEQQENLKETGELLDTVETTTAEFADRASKLTTNSREKLPPEIKNIISPTRMVAEGVGKSILGLGVDLAEGAGSFLYTWGLSEIVPVPEFIADFGTAKFAETFTGRELRRGPKFWGYTLSFLPYIGDFASPTFFDGMMDIYQGSKALVTGDRSNLPSIKPA